MSHIWSILWLLVKKKSLRVVATRKLIMKHPPEARGQSGRSESFVRCGRRQPWFDCLLYTLLYSQHIYALKNIQDDTTSMVSSTLISFVSSCITNRSKSAGFHFSQRSTCCFCFGFTNRKFSATFELHTYFSSIFVKSIWNNATSGTVNAVDRYINNMQQWW